MEISYRKAVIGDIGFVCRCIMEAEKSGMPKAANQLLFDLSDDEYRQLIMNILNENIEGSEYCCNHFYLALDETLPVGGFAMWVEGSGTQSSNMIKAGLLSYFVGIDKWKKAHDSMNLISSVTIPRTPGLFQIDAGYVDPAYRGHGISPAMNHYAIELLAKQNKQVRKVQTSCIIENNRSLKTLLKAGFRITKEKQSADITVSRFIPGTGFYQLELDLTEQFEI